MNFGLLVDLHGTLLDSNYAWIEAFKEIDFVNLAFYESEIWKKTSRKELAEVAGIEYSELEKIYRLKLRPRYDVVKLIQKLNDNYPMVIVSNSARSKIIKDIQILQPMNFLKIYSFEDGKKPDPKYLEKILLDMGWDKAYLIGNDYEEDYIAHDNITSILIPYKRIVK